MKPDVRFILINENTNTEEIEKLFEDGYGVLGNATTSSFLTLVKMPESKIVTPGKK